VPLFNVFSVQSAAFFKLIFFCQEIPVGQMSLVILTVSLTCEVYIVFGQHWLSFIVVVVVAAAAAAASAPLLTIYRNLLKSGVCVCVGV
jgi:hypothetical protein